MQFAINCTAHARSSSACALKCIVFLLYAMERGLAVSALLLSYLSVCSCQSPHLSDPCSNSDIQRHNGDIAYFTVDVSQGSASDFEGGSERRRRAATSQRELLWPGAVVVYDISPSFSERERLVILRAMEHWEENTCIRFKKKTFESVHVYFYPGSGCCSYIGRVGFTMAQGVSLSRNCLSFAAAVHEIGHVVGFWHEQSRPDRDDFVNVLLSHILPGFEENFRKLARWQVNSLGVGYDYNSIMHYSSSVFSRGAGLNTLRAKPDAAIPIGMAVELSELDILQANRLYSCDVYNSPPKMITVPTPTPTPPPPSPSTPYNCGSVFVNVSGSFVSPGYPSHRHNLDCGWVIQAPPGYWISLAFQPLRIEHSIHCHKDYVEVFESIQQTGLSRGRVCGNYYSYEVAITGRRAFVRYHTDASDLYYERGHGFQATVTLLDIDECSSDAHPCTHRCNNFPGGFSCSCDDGFFLSADGKTCFDVNECALGNGGCQQECVNSAGSFRCECNPDYYLQPDGKSCNQLGRRCSVDNGGCSHSCTTAAYGRKCGCEAGFKLDIDGETCIDLNECIEGRHSCSQVCANTFGSYRCACQPGFQLSTNQLECREVNECGVGGQHGCDAGSGASCLNTYGSYMCVCPGGHRLDGTGLRCEDVNECVSGEDNCDQPSGAACVNTIGSFTCSCPNGYQLDSSERSCQDIDECAIDNGGCQQSCKNQAGGFKCSCETGYQRVDKTKCLVKSCELRNGGCKHVCFYSIDGVAMCKCRSGYVQRQTGSRKRCYALDDPERPSDAICGLPCDTTCVREDKHFHCECHDDMVLQSDGVTCRANPCDSAGCEQLCTATGGNSTVCSCQSGYLPAPDGKKCLDVNECVDNNGGCAELCVNTNGSFLCACRLENHTLSDDGTSCEMQCGGHLTSDGGSLHIWPSSYPPDTTCTWTLRLTNSSGAIRLSINSSRQSLTTCPDEDYSFEIRNGIADDAVILGQWSCDTPPFSGSLTTSTSEATLSLRTGSSGALTTALRIEYETVARPEGNSLGGVDCTSTYIASKPRSQGRFLCEGIVLTGEPFGPPDFPSVVSQSPTESYCMWRFLGDGDQQTRSQLKLLYFDIPASTDCAEDRLEVYNGLFVDYPRIATLCGNVTGQHIVTAQGESGYLLVRLKVVTQRAFRGFHAVFVSV